MVNMQRGKRAACNHRVMDARGRLLSMKEARELHEEKDCRSFSVLKTLAGYWPYSHSILSLITKIVC